MPKFKVKYTIESIYELEFDAPDAAQALRQAQEFTTSDDDIIRQDWLENEPIATVYKYYEAQPIEPDNGLVGSNFEDPNKPEPETKIRNKNKSGWFAPEDFES